MTGGRHIAPATTAKLLSEQISKSQLRELVRTKLAPEPPVHHDTPAKPTTPNHIPSDFDLNPGMRAEENPHSRLRAAAVLIPIYFKPEPMVLFTKRTQHLNSHAGQISFPGGKIDQTDANPTQAALREAHEELELQSNYIEPLGFLDSYETRTRFLIAPLLAILKPGFKVKPDPNEVAEIFEVPLKYLMNPQNHHKHSGTLNGKTRYYYAVPYKTRYIWGATAGILINMHERLFAR